MNLKTSNMYKQISISLLLKPVALLISLFLVPITIAYLGNTFYGIWATILSILSWMSFFDIGIGNGLRNHLTTEITRGNFKSAREYIITAYTVISVISVVVMIFASLSFNFINWRSVFNVDTISNRDLLIIMLANLLFICTNFVLQMVSIIFHSLQKSSVSGVIQIVNQIFVLIGIIIVKEIIHDNSLLGVSIVYGLSTVITNLIFTVILFLYNKHLIPKITDFKMSRISSLMNIGAKFFIIQIAALIIFTTSNMIITQLFGPDEVTPYNITYKIFSIIIMLHGIIITPIWSAITKAYAEKDNDWIHSTLNKLNKFQILIVIVSIAAWLSFQFILKIWIGDTVVIPDILVINFAIYVILSTFCNNYAYVFNGIGEISFQLVVAVIQAVVNIPLSIVFATTFGLGIAGVILGTNVTMLIAAILYPFKMTSVLRRIKHENV